MAVAALVVAAGIPLTANQWAEFNTRRGLRARSEMLRTVGRQALERHDYTVAAEAFGGAAAGDPSDGSLAEELLGARVELALEQPTAFTAPGALALEVELRAAAARAGGKPVARQTLALGRMLQYRGAGDAARDLFKTVATQDPNDAAAALYYGDALLKASLLDEAAGVLQHAVALDGKAPLAQFAYGQVLLSQGKFAEAHEHLLAAVGGQPNNAQALLALGKAENGLKKWTEARASLERALALAPDLLAAQIPLGEADVNLGNAEGAIVAFKTAYEKGGDTNALRYLARVYLQLSRFADASPLYQTLNRMNADDAEALLALGTCAAGLNDVAGARAAFARCIEVAQGKPEAEPVLKVAQQRLEALNKGSEEAAAPAPESAPAAGHARGRETNPR